MRRLRGWRTRTSNRSAWKLMDQNPRLTKKGYRSAGAHTNLRHAIPAPPMESEEIFGKKSNASLERKALTHVVTLVPLGDKSSEDPRAVPVCHVDPARRWDRHQVVAA